MAPGSPPHARPQPGQAWSGWVKMGGKWPKLEAPAPGGLWAQPGGGDGSCLQEGSVVWLVDALRPEGLRSPTRF